MGIPIELPSTPAPRSGPCHSAKPSWSSSGQHFPSSSSSSSLSSSTSVSSSSPSSLSNPFPVVPPALSLARQQLLQDTRPPLASLAYHPPPPPSSLQSQPGNISSSPSTYRSFPLLSSSQGNNNGINVDQSTWIQQARADIALASASAATTAAAAAVTAEEEMEIQSPSPTRAARPHPNLRRISRVPVFMTSPSGSGTTSGSGPAGMSNLSMRAAHLVASTMTSTIEHNSSYNGDTMAAGATAPTFAISNMDSSSMMFDSPPPASQPRPIWHPSSPSLVHYSTRPLPPVPRPTSTNAQTVEQPYGQPYQQERQQEALPQERASWNYRFVNMNHADNHNRPETTTLSGSGSGTMMHGYYYEDDRLRHDHSPTMRSHHHNHYQHLHSADSLSTGAGTVATAATTTGMTASANADASAFSSSSTSLLVSRPRQYNPMRGGSESTNTYDFNEEEWILQQQYQHHQHSGRRFRHRPSLPNRERDLHLERELQREQHLHRHHHLHNGQMTLSPPPLLSPTSLTPSSSQSNNNSSSGSTTLMTPVPSFLQGHPTVARTLIRADAFQQGVIYIYPENHAPIRMYGRPILTPTPPHLLPRPSLSPSSPLGALSPGSVMSLSSASSLTNNSDSAAFVDPVYDDLTVHIPARPLATPPSSAGLSSFSITDPSSSTLAFPISSLPSPTVTTSSVSTLVSQEISETTTPAASAYRSEGRATTTVGLSSTLLSTSTTPVLARPPSAALSPVLNSGEIYRFSSSPSSSSPPSSSSFIPYSGSPQTPPSSSTSMSLTLMRPLSTMQASSRSQSVALTAEEEGFEELLASESHHHHRRTDDDFTLDGNVQQQQPPVHPLDSVGE